MPRLPSASRAARPASRSAQFVKLLGSGAGYFFEDGNLTIDLMADGGTMDFAPASDGVGTGLTMEVQSSNDILLEPPADLR